ncbi:SDR family NAD(P)-dependent oxidoreductase [Streptomyces sp. NPDC056656]|uniref:SDR family NAD(P)-dependent oxidoreductase n=1 Tax=Streptomyces sp. NPDC056656 TaxID=3345895 RepID=UPI0036C9C5B2
MTTGSGSSERLAGRAAIVTGGARGIGAAITRCLAAAGARVVIADVLDSEGAALATELGAAARYAHVDVRRRDDWESAVALSREAFGLPLSVLIHNAGVMTPGTVASTDEESLTLALDVNLLGPVIGTQVCLPGMIDGGGGSVVVMSSIASLSVGPGFIPYAVSKAANAVYARAAARELGPHGIRVNSLHPGGVETPMNSGPGFAALDKDAWFGRMPIPRIGRPAEIAAAALFLASDDSSYVTGTQLVVDGGQLLGPRATWDS